MCRLSLDKRGGKCHSIQQPPRAAACLDTACPQFLLITAWEISACVCWELPSLPAAGSEETVPSSFGGLPGWCWGLGSQAGHRQDSPVPGTLPWGWGHSSGSPAPCAAWQCQGAAASPGAASNSEKPLRNSRVGTNWGCGRLQCPGHCHCPLQRDTEPTEPPAPPGMAPCPGWTRCPCAGPK